MNARDTMTARTAAIVWTAFLIGLSAGIRVANAQPAQDIANRVPLSVSEVIVGGQWGASDAGGVYRAILIYRIIDDMPVSDILVQWLELGEDGPRIAHSETITSITGEQATTAFVAFDFGEEGAGEATRLLIGSFDPDANADETQFVRLGPPAEFEFVSPPPRQETGQ